MALSGIALMAFIVVHLAGNLTLFGNGELFNQYAHKLEGLGPLLWVAEAGLLAIFLYHVITAIQIQLGKRAARGGSYAVTASKGGPSKQTIASRSMIITGLVLLVFVPLHVWMFKFNWGNPHPVTEISGEKMNDLYATVAEHFKNPAWVLGYVAVMLFLGLHLRHGFWSSLQSLGAMNPKCSPLIYAGGLIFAALMAGGFLILPVYIYLKSCGLCCGGAP